MRYLEKNRVRTHDWGAPLKGREKRVDVEHEDRQRPRTIKYQEKKGERVCATLTQYNG